MLTAQTKGLGSADDEINSQKNLTGHRFGNGEVVREVSCLGLRAFRHESCGTTKMACEGDLNSLSTHLRH